MEPITFTAIVAALSAGVVAGIGKVGENALVDASGGLTRVLRGFAVGSRADPESDLLFTECCPHQPTPESTPFRRYRGGAENPYPYPSDRQQP